MTTLPLLALLGMSLGNYIYAAGLRITGSRYAIGHYFLATISCLLLIVLGHGLK